MKAVFFSGVAAAALLAAGASATDVTLPHLINKQTGSAPIESDNELFYAGGPAVSDTLEAQASSVGNLADFDMGVTVVQSITSRQKQGHGVIAMNFLDAFAQDGVEVTSAAQATANDLVVTAKDIEGDQFIANKQFAKPLAHTPAKYADLDNLNQTQAENTTLLNGGGEVMGLASAVDNRFDVVAKGEFGVVTNKQVAKNRETTSLNTADIQNATRDVTLTSAASNSQFIADLDPAGFLDVTTMQKTKGADSIVRATSSINAANLGDDLFTTTDATANLTALDIHTNNAVIVDNDQRFTGLVEATADITVDGIADDFRNTTRASANVMQLDVRGASMADVYNNQKAVNDPVATTNIIAANIGDVFSSVTSSASTTALVSVNNSALGARLNEQTNKARSAAISNVSLTNVGGPISSVATASGNIYTLTARR